MVDLSGVRAALIAVALQLACGLACVGNAPGEPVPSATPAQCKAGVLAAGSSLSGSVRRVALPGAPPARIVDLPFTTRGRRQHDAASKVETLPAEAIAKWAQVRTPLGTRRRSPPFATPAALADTLILEVDRGAADTIDITVLPSDRDLPAIDWRHRTVRLEFPESGGSTHVFEISLQPLLRGTWNDMRASATERFFLEVGTELPGKSLRRVEVRPRSARFEGPGARRTDGPPGALRPGFHLWSGAALRVPIPASSESRTLVLHLHGALGKPTVSVGLVGSSPIASALPAPREGWARHEIDIPSGAASELRFKASGTGVVLLGDPTLWATPKRNRPPDVVIYMIDTLLASRLGALGSEVPAVSPVMDGVVNNGLAFVRASSTSAWTKPAIPSLLTGVYPLTHRVGTRTYTDRVPKGAPMVQERFREAGFRTLSASASPLGSTLSGLERGFDLAHPPARWAEELGPLEQPEARQLQAALLSFVDEDPSRPVFAYLHTLDVHEHGRPMFSKGHGDTPYDRAIRYQDAALGELLKAYKERKRELILVLVSDHGEGFGEYNVQAGHGFSLRQNQIHVPIVFHAPQWLPRGRVTDPASIVDVAPTLLDLFSLPPLPLAQGRSLLPGSSASDVPRAVYAERTWFLWEPEGPALLARLGADGSKVVTGYPRPLSWNLDQNPCEDMTHALAIDAAAQADLHRFEQEQEVAAARWDATYGSSGPGRIDPDDIARLRALGYLE